MVAVVDRESGKWKCRFLSRRGDEVPFRSVLQILFSGTQGYSMHLLFVMWMNAEYTIHPNSNFEDGWWWTHFPMEYICILHYQKNHSETVRLWPWTSQQWPNPGTFHATSRHHSKLYAPSGSASNQQDFRSESYIAISLQHANLLWKNNHLMTTQ